MNQIIQMVVTTMQIVIAVMLIPFLFLQYRVRHKGSSVVQKLRQSITWQTISLLSSFIAAAFLSRDGFDQSVVGQVTALVITGFLFVTFLNATKIYLDIYRGKYDDEIK